MIRLLLSLLVSLVFGASTLLFGTWEVHESLKAKIKRIILFDRYSEDIFDSIDTLNNLRGIFANPPLDKKTFDFGKSILTATATQPFIESLDKLSPAFWNSTKKESLLVETKKEFLEERQNQISNSLEEPRRLLANFLGVQGSAGESATFQSGILRGLPSLRSFENEPETLVDLANMLSRIGSSEAPIRGYKPNEVVAELGRIHARTDELLAPFLAPSDEAILKVNMLHPDAKLIKEEVRSYLLDIVTKIQLNFF